MTGKPINSAGQTSAMDAIHWNPWKPKFTHASGGDASASEQERMNWSDAAKASLILCVAQLFMVYLPGRALPSGAADYYGIVVFMGQSFFSSFVTLTGLSLLNQKVSK